MRLLPTLATRGLALVLLAGTVDAALPVDAVAAPTTAPVRIEIAVVRASHGAASVDPALSTFAADLRSMPYERFERLSGKSVSTAVGVRQEIALSNDLRAVITVDSADDSGAAATVALFRGTQELTHTIVRRPWGRAQVIGVGRTGEDALVVPIAVLR